jgi:glutathione-regulated potassium-efflux system ancillary protein KefG
MQNVLILFAHPALAKSRVNRRLIEAVRGLECVRLHDLYEEYPDLFIDVEREQRLLVESDVVVFQHPFYWYSTPAMLKEWQDLVLEHGWAYGSGGETLRGKTFLSAITAGGSEASYCPQGRNCLTMRQLLAPVEQTARLCGMDYLPPFVVHGTHALDDDGILRHAADYRRTLIALRDGTLDRQAAASRPRLNADLASLIRG